MTTSTRLRQVPRLIALVVLAVAVTPANVVATSRSPGGAPMAGVVAAPTAVGPWSALGSNGAGNGAMTFGEFDYPKLISMGNDVYAAGNFQNLAGISAADYIAKWNGSAWSALGSNGFGGGVLDGPVSAMAVSGTTLYVAGQFTGGIAKWDGNSWSAVGNSGLALEAINVYIEALAISGGNLYVAGYFHNLAGLSKADYLAKWNGTVWSAVGSNGAGASLNNEAVALAVQGNNLYVGGWFTDAGGVANADGVALWDGSTWSALGVGINIIEDYGVNALAVSGSNVYVGGFFSDVADNPAASNVAMWNGSAWSALGSDGEGYTAIKGVVIDLAVSRTGDVYVVGDFSEAGNVATADYASKWNGTTWSGLGSNGSGDGALGNRVWSVASTNDGIYVGGEFFNAASIPEADYVAKWALPANQADGRIRVGRGTLLGNNTYNITGSGQVRSAKVTRGHSATFDISIQNDGWKTDSFHVTSTTRATTGYGVTYVRGAADITDALVHRQYFTPSLAPGSSFVITVRVDVGSNAAKGSGISELVTLTSVGDSTKKDAVQFTVKRAK